MMFSIKDTQYDENSKIDLSGYATTSTTDKLTISIDALEKSMANKLNSNPVDHKHTINQIEQLSQTLANKLAVPSTEESKYSYNTLLKDWKKIPYLEAVKIPKLDIAVDESTSGYVFNVDKSGDLIITTSDGIVVTFYDKAKGTWFIGETNLNAFITNTNEVLKNHYEALMIILDKLGYRDKDTTDGDKVTPVEKVTEVETE